MFCMGWFWFWILITRSHSISQIGLELIVICLSSASVELQAWAAMPGLKEVFVSIYWLSLWHFYTHAHASARNHWSLSPLSPSESPHSQLVPFLRWRLLWGKPQFSFLTFIPPCAPRFLSGMLSSIWRTFSILPLWCSLKGATSLSFWKVSLGGGGFLGRILPLDTGFKIDSLGFCLYRCCLRFPGLFLNNPEVMDDQVTLKLWMIWVPFSTKTLLPLWNFWSFFLGHLLSAVWFWYFSCTCRAFV